MNISADVLRSTQNREKRKDIKRIGANNVRARKDSDVASAAEAEAEVAVATLAGIAEMRA